MAIRAGTSNAALAVIVLMAVGSAVPAAASVAPNKTDPPRSAHTGLSAAIQPTSPATAAPEAKPSNKPRPTQKPKPTPTPTPVPVRTTPRPVPRTTPRPTAAPTPSAAQATATALLSSESPPIGAGQSSEPPFGLVTGDNVVIPVSLILAAVGVLILIRVARGRMVPDLQDGALEAAETALPAPPDRETRRALPQPEPTGEEHLPRWRRPSVVAARFETVNTVAIRAAAVAKLPSRLRPVKRFDSGADVDRWVLRYDGVVLLDRPDDVHGRPMEGLQADDEVALLERDELWANVATPGGRAGWIPAMALGRRETAATVAEAEPAAPELTVTAAPVESSTDDTVIESLLGRRADGQPDGQGA
jgi:hypothetical protein